MRKVNGVMKVFILLLVVAISVVSIMFLKSKNTNIISEFELGNTNIKIKRNSYFILKANVYNVENPVIKWDSSDSGIASIDNSGVIKGENYGKAIIMAKYTNSSGKTLKKECTVEVYDGEDGVEVQEISLPKGDLVLGKGMSYDLNKSLTTSPSNAYIQSIEYINSDDNIAVINNGIIKFSKVGKTRVTIRVNGLYETKINVYCVDKPNISEIITNPSRIEIINKNTSLNIDDKVKINYSLSPDNASSDLIKITSDNEEVLSIDNNGNIIAKSEGEAVVTVEAINGVNASVKIKVLPKSTPTPTITPTPTPPPTPEVTITPEPNVTPIITNPSNPNPTTKPSTTAKPSTTTNPNTTAAPSNDGKRTCKISNDPMDTTYNSCFEASKNLILSRSIGTMKVGESVTIHVTLPNCGTFMNYTRTTADGSTGWDQYISQSRSNLSSSGFDWTIKANRRGSVCASQTVQYDAKSPSGKCSGNVKSMKTICFDVR